MLSQKDVLAKIAAGISMSDAKNKKTILIVGKTGTGKSTLATLLDGDEMTSQPKNPNIIGEFFYVSKESSRFKISDKLLSETYYPTISSYGLTDCPGFDDKKKKKKNAVGISRNDQLSKSLVFNKKVSKNQISKS
jgi:energy-coupling factor transporter ATP-binding protein EcfA2